MKIRMGYRYAAVIVIGAGFGLLCAVLVRWRALFEPFAGPLFSLMFRGQQYQPVDYWVFPALCALIALIAVVATIHGITTREAVEQRLDRYLERRMPGHETDP